MSLERDLLSSFTLHKDLTVTPFPFKSSILPKDMPSIIFSLDHFGRDIITEVFQERGRNASFTIPPPQADFNGHIHPAAQAIEECLPMVYEEHVKEMHNYSTIPRTYHHSLDRRTSFLFAPLGRLFITEQVLPHFASFLCSSDNQLVPEIYRHPLFEMICHGTLEIAGEFRMVEITKKDWLNMVGLRHKTNENSLTKVKTDLDLNIHKIVAYLHLGPEHKVSTDAFQMMDMKKILNEINRNRLQARDSPYELIQRLIKTYKPNAIEKSNL